MAEKRGRGRPRLSDAPVKRRRSSLGQDTPAKEPTSAPAPQADALPAGITSSIVFPTVKQDYLALDQQYKSIAESGVLEAALKWSRNAWLNDSLFELYWTKPTKKKGQSENPNNPPKESMTKVGPCRITIEPHVFQATLYSIKKWPPISVAPAGPGLETPTSRPSVAQSPISFPQARPSIPNANLPTPPSFTPVPVQPVQPAQQIQQPLTPIPSLPQLDGTSSLAARPAGVQTTPSSANVLDSKQGSINLSHASAVPAPPMVPALTPMAPKPSQGPVIQMLAQRASANPELKVLMKIVAAGNATREQLTVFQSHIDELNAILLRQAQANNSVQIAPQSYGDNTSRAPSSGTPLYRPAPQPMSFNQPPKFHVSSQTKPKPRPLPVEELVGVAIEFSDVPSQRYLFPKRSILETSSDGKQLNASFLIVRKTTTKGDKPADDATEYYQPVTIRLDAENPKWFNPIYRTVVSVEEAKKYMEEVMAKAQAAEDVRLRTQLPEKSDALEEDEPAMAWANLLAATSRKKSTAALADVIGSTRGTGRRKKSEDLEPPRCQYCFADLSMQQDSDRALAVCQTCSVLQTESTTRSGNRPARAIPALPLRWSSGVQALVFANAAKG